MSSICSQGRPAWALLTTILDRAQPLNDGERAAKLFLENLRCDQDLMGTVTAFLY